MLTESAPFRDTARMATKIDIDSLPSDLEKIARRYRSVGAAVKANDVEAVRILGTHLKESVNEEMVNLLLWRGAPSIKPDMAAELVKLGANPRMLHYVSDGTDQISAGTHAARTGNAELLAWFITQGHFTADDMDGSGNSFLASALVAGQLSTATRLKELGADLNARNFHEETAFHLAAGYYQVQSMVWMVENGADPTIEADDGCNVAQCVPLQVQGHAGSEWHPDVMSRFIDEYAQAFRAARAAGQPAPVMEVPADVRAEVAFERGPEPPATPAAVESVRSEDAGVSSPSRPKM